MKNKKNPRNLRPSVRYGRGLDGVLKKTAKKFGQTTQPSHTSDQTTFEQAEIPKELGNRARSRRTMAGRLLGGLKKK